jgi:hypothetical protein
VAKPITLPPEDVAARIRKLAAGVSDPADAATIEGYARQLEREAAAKNRAVFFAPPKK